MKDEKLNHQMQNFISIRHPFKIKNIKIQMKMQRSDMQKRLPHMKNVKCETTFAQSAFSYRNIQFWNNIPPEVKHQTNYSTTLAL